MLGVQICGNKTHNFESSEKIYSLILATTKANASQNILRLDTISFIHMKNFTTTKDQKTDEKNGECKNAY